MKDDELVAEIEAKLVFQVKWKRIMSAAYFTTTALGLVFSAAATVVAGVGYSLGASILAGSATALFGLEKALLFREKWTHHLNSAMQLEALKIEYQYGTLDATKTSQRLAEILTSYAARLPVTPRIDLKRASSTP
jgi:hypothetical protein